MKRFVPLTITVDDGKATREQAVSSQHGLAEGIEGLRPAAAKDDAERLVRTGSGSDWVDARSEPETRNSKLETGAPRRDRAEESYVIDAGLKLLKVLEGLEGRAFEPVTIERAMQRSGFNRSFTRSALITLKRAGWAKELLDGRKRSFVLGPKAETMARGFAASMLSRDESGAVARP